MSAEQNKELVRRFYDDFCTGRQLDLADELMTPDFVYHDPQIPTVIGPQAMADAVALIQTSVDGHWHIESLYAAENDHVVCRWTGTGTHVGEFVGLPPTGKPFKIEAIALTRIANGKLTEQWIVWDTLGFMQQLGVVPTPGAE